MAWITANIPEEWVEWAKARRAERDAQFEHSYPLQSDHAYAGDIAERWLDEELTRRRVDHHWHEDDPHGPIDFTVGDLTVDVKCRVLGHWICIDQGIGVNHDHAHHEEVREFLLTSYCNRSRILTVCAAVDRLEVLKASLYRKGDTLPGCRRPLGGDDMYQVWLDNRDELNLMDPEEWLTSLEVTV